MKTKNLLHKILCVVAAVALSLFFVFEYTLSKPFKVSATETKSGYTNVLSDLEKDSTFDIDDYPEDADDDSLSVIQIAESSDSELFVYTYNPSGNKHNFIASYVSMYLGESTNGEDFKPKLYTLTLVSTQEVFDKYVVDNCEVSDEDYRYYNIVSIYRPYNAEVDGKDLSIGNTEDVAYEVGQQWCAYDYKGETFYEMNTFETVEIEVVANGYVTFKHGFSWSDFVGQSSDCDAHFVCFNFPNRKVRYIYDADLTYRVRKKTRKVGIGHSGDWEYGEYSQPIEVTLKDTDVATFEDGGIYEKTYEWKRITSASNFVYSFVGQNGEFYEADKQTILSSQWVFAFCETENDFVSGMGFSTYYEYDVEDVAILRIHFRDISGDTYNLGVVGNITSSSKEPSGVAGPDDDWPEWVYWLIGGLLLVVGLSVLSVVAVFAGPIFKLIWKVITIPFKVIGKLLKGLGRLFKGKK